MSLRIISPGWEVFRFPAGEPSTRPDTTEYRDPTQVALVQGTDANDYIALRLWAETVRRHGRKPRALIPYLPAARDDHEPAMGMRAYADLINACGLEQVICLDPHSPAMPALINNCTVLYGIPLLEQALAKADRYEIAGVIVPDAGAVQRSTHIAERLGVPTYQALKHRDPATGKLSGFTCEPLPGDGMMLVADDICDGGGTFMGIADATGLPKERLALWVTHGVFSGRAEQLFDRYQLIMSTDSLGKEGKFPHIEIPCVQYMLDHIKKEQK